MKPTASRQQSAEIYYLCMDYDNSLDEQVIRTKAIQKRMTKLETKLRLAEEDGGKKLTKPESAESDAFFDELTELSK